MFGDEIFLCKNIIFYQPEDPVGAEQPRRDLLADVELRAGGLLTVVAGLTAGEEGAHRDQELRL